MSAATSTIIGLAGLGLAGGSAVASGIGKSKAAGAQQKGSEQAQAVEKQNQDQAVLYTKQNLNDSLAAQNTAQRDQRQMQQPYLAAGSTGVNSLRNLLSAPGQGLLQNYGDFSAPTLADAEKMPGYQFEKQEGINSLDQSAAAKGNLFSGTQGRALIDYGNNVATTNYQQAYSNALNTYGTNRDTFNQGQTNTANRLLSLAGIGQNAANTSSNLEAENANAQGNLYSGASSNVSNTLVNGSQAQAQQINNAAAARASGYTGVGDAIAGGLTYGANWLTDQNMLSQLRQNQLPIPSAPDSWMLNQGTAGVSP